jgi:HK97 family phage major capsid protein
VPSTKDELLAELATLTARVQELDSQYAESGQWMDPQSQDGQEWNRSNLKIEEIKKITAQMQAREDRIAVLVGDEAATGNGAPFNLPAPGAVRGEDIWNLASIRMSASSPEDAKIELQERGKRAIEGAYFPHERADQAECKATLETMLARVDNDRGDLARHLLVTGSPTYQTAFGKALRGQQLQGAEISALSLGGSSGADGGYAVPFILDPTLIPTSDNKVNPYRAISRVVQIVGSNEWKGVTTGAVTAHRRAEGTEVSDDSPTLAQPDVKAQRVDVFIPFSMELQQDWGAMQSELARLIQDAKDVEEATSFTTGAGTGVTAQGIVTGATVTVTTASTATFADVDLDSCENALGNRFQQRAQWVGNRAIYNLIRHFDQYGGPDLWVRIAEPLAQGGNTGRTLLGYPANEASAMASTHATADTILVLGDFNYFLILDRIGMQMELVPHLFGSASRYPTGQRGFFAYWRNNSAVLSARAFRALVVK